MTTTTKIWTTSKIDLTNNRHDPTKKHKDLSHSGAAGFCCPWLWKCAIHWRSIVSSTMSLERSSRETGLCLEMVSKWKSCTLTTALRITTTKIHFQHSVTRIGTSNSAQHEQMSAHSMKHTTYYTRIRYTKLSQSQRLFFNSDNFHAQCKFVLCLCDWHWDPSSCTWT